LTAYLGHLLDNVNVAPKRIHPGHLEARQFAPSKAAVRRYEDQGSVVVGSVLDELGDLLSVQERHLRSRSRREPHAFSRVGVDEPGEDCTTHEVAHDLDRAPNGGGCESLGLKLGNPSLNIPGGDAAKVTLAESWNDVVPQAPSRSIEGCRPKIQEGW
jgi:hypothetical protein